MVCRRSVMLALSHRSALYIRQRGATTLSSSIYALYFRRIRFSTKSATLFPPPQRVSRALAVAISCAAVGGLFMSHTALSDSGHSAPAVVASVPPSATSFTATGDVPSSASHLNLSFSAGPTFFSYFIRLHRVSHLVFSACEASNDPIEDRFVVAVSRSSNVCIPRPSAMHR